MDTKKKDRSTGETRRSFLKSAAGVVGSSAMGSLSSPSAWALPGRQSAGSPPGRPNILLIHSHDLGRFLGCYGNKTVHTPRLDRLASEGVLFTGSYATAPQCSPSRASIFTGRYPHSNGVMGLTQKPFWWDLYPSEAHLGQVLKAAGYKTAGTGILHETHSGPARCGLDEFRAGEGWATEVADASIEMLRAFAQDQSRPFYLQAGTREPHRLPNPDPRKDLGFIGQHLSPDTRLGVTIPPYLLDTEGTRAEVAELQGAVAHVDEQVGRMLDALETLGLTANTLVIYTTDHGVALPRAKCSVYDPGVETAFLLRLPSRPGWHGGHRQDAMVSNISYLPTILDAAGVEVPANVQGRSLAPLLDGKPFEECAELFFEMTYHDYYDPLRAIRTRDHKLIVYFSTAPGFMDPSQSWRPRSEPLVPANDALAFHPTMELYDLRADPFERQNIAAVASQQEVLGDLRRRLARHMIETQDPLLKGAVASPAALQALEWLSQPSGRPA